jgi:hypothetical protein
MINENVNVWAVQVDTTEASEAVQRVAFSFGYGWPGEWPFTDGVKEVNHTDRKSLYFYPDEKVIRHGTNPFESIVPVCKVCTTIVEVIQLLKNPPVAKKVKTVSMSKCGSHDVFADGSVLIRDRSNDRVTVAVLPKEMEEVIKTRNELMGKKEDKNESKKLYPLIQFLYNSPSSGKRVRRVAFVEDKGEAYACLDLDDNNLYKLFRKDRMSRFEHPSFLGTVEVKVS